MSYSAVGLKTNGFIVTPLLTLNFLIKVLYLVIQVPPFASVYPAVESLVQAEPGSSPTLPKISMIFPSFSNVIASSPLK